MNTNGKSRDPKGFLEFLVRSAPRIKPSPFFAARVAKNAEVERYSFAGSFQAFSRRLVPLFMTVMVVVCFAVYRWTGPDLLVESAAFYEEEYLAETITVEHVVDSLAILLEEENENH